MKSHVSLIPMMFAALMLASCERIESRGFSLPKGDVSAGKTAFVKFQCAACHTVAGMEELRKERETVMTLPLGGETTRIQTYGELVTSVINPSHIISKNFPGTEVSAEGQSKMRSYNDVITVKELIDLVEFLQSQYVLKNFSPTDYPVFVIPAW